MTPRTRQLTISLVVKCVMFMQNLDCEAKDASFGGPMLIVTDILQIPVPTRAWSRFWTAGTTNVPQDGALASETARIGGLEALELVALP